MLGKGLLKGMGITFKHTFEKKDLVVQYPEQMPHLQERYRGSLAFRFEKCIACGMCTRTCPNHVLSMETAKDEGSKKKKLLSYTIDLQYCMFCNLCVEACPANALYFSHDFELSKYNRSDIPVVYHRPPEMDQKDAESEAAKDNGAAAAADEDKKQKQIQAMIGALNKNPQKILSKIVDTEESAQILAEILLADEKKLAKVAALMVEDKDKAKKVGMAFVQKELKERNGEGGDK